MNRIGKTGRKNLEANARLKAEFKESGQAEYCELRFEGCKGGIWLSWAHPKKRRYLLEGELDIAILACTPCHDILDDEGKTSKEEMCDKVYAVIAARGQEP